MSLSGQTLRGYELREIMGTGGFATVYRGWHAAVGREVAVKAIRAQLADDPSFVRRFEREAQIIARLEHPHIVPLYDFWREPGGAYLVMRLMRGGSLVEKKGVAPADLVRMLRVRELATGRTVWSHSGVATDAAAFSPDGSYPLTGEDRDARLWEARAGAEVRRFIGHRAYIDSVAFSADGRRIVTASSADNTVRLWDVRTGRSERVIAVPRLPVIRVAFSPDGRQVAAGYAGSTVRLWETDYRDTVARVCGRLFRDLTAEERATYGIAGDAPTCPHPGR